VTIEIKREKSRSIRFSKGEILDWLPKSQIKNCIYESREPQTIIIPEWLAREKRLI